MATQPLPKKRKVKDDADVWTIIGTIVNTIQPLSFKLNNYKAVLKQIARLTKREELEQLHDVPEGQIWNDLYIWTATSGQQIYDYIMMWWTTLRQRWKDLMEESKKKHSEEELTRLEHMTQAINTELRRWKRIIRCTDEEMDAIEEKTMAWAKTFVEKWGTTQGTYNSLEKRFVSIFNAYANSKMTSSKKDK
jgi:hypothetical protein